MLLFVFTHAEMLYAVSFYFLFKCNFGLDFTANDCFVERMMLIASAWPQGFLV